MYIHISMYIVICIYIYIYTYILYSEGSPRLSFSAEIRGVSDRPPANI